MNTCGHPNHNASDHDCAPFLHAAAQAAQASPDPDGTTGPALTPTDFLLARMAEAWDEGWNAAVDSNGFPGDVNPHRAAALAAVVARYSEAASAAHAAAFGAPVRPTRVETPEPGGAR